MRISSWDKIVKSVPGRAVAKASGFVPSMAVEAVMPNWAYRVRKSVMKPMMTVMARLMKVLIPMPLQMHLHGMVMQTRMAMVQIISP